MATFNNDAGKDIGEGNSYLNQIKNLTSQIKKNYEKVGKSLSDKEISGILDKIEANLKKQGKTLEDWGKTAKQIRDEQYDAAIENSKIEAASSENLRGKLAASAKAFSASVKKAGLETAEKLINGALNLGAAFDKGIEEYAHMYGQYSSKINARLQTFDRHEGEAFNSLSKLVRKNLAASPYIKQEEMLQSLNSLIDQGISYNVEQRAFLATVTDKIVTTFNALDTTLLRMVRLQQMDTTQARMGMEAQLTKYLNSTYQDTSYLNGLYDTVTENLFEASSQLGRNASIELEYVVQKWLGSMSSVGVGDAFLSSISQGLGYLGSGNVDALSGNSSLQNLLVMAANRSGVDYSGILSQGLNADTANKLLSGIASYVREISQSNNQVVRSQYAQIFGMTLSDMTAMLNLSSKDLASISQNMLSYGDTIRELESQLSDVGSRMHISQMIENVFDNFMTGVAGNIAGNAGSYVTWKVIDLVEKATGGIAIPTAGVMGNFVDLETTVTGLMKTGIVGMSVIGQIGSILKGLSSGGSLSLDTWAGEESTSRGSGFGAITSGYSKTTSTSAYIGSSSGDDIYSSSVTAAKDKAVEENKGNEDEEEPEIITLTKAILAVISESGIKIADNQMVTLSNYGLYPNATM